MSPDVRKHLQTRVSERNRRGSIVLRATLLRFFYNHSHTNLDRNEGERENEELTRYSSSRNGDRRTFCYNVSMVSRGHRSTIATKECLRYKEAVRVACVRA